jgi:UDP-N-acetylmuramoyl-tripeptide--D-alanyl-D-alanine ligase
MTMTTLQQAAMWITDATVVGDGTTAFSHVSTDSRAAGPGDLFVALRGERFDAHDFLPAVALQDANAVLVTRAPADLGLPYLLVEDTRIALGELARGWRRRFTLPIVAVTGSNGKTTVKEMISSIFLAEAGDAGRLATRGNLNNDIGLPLTVLRLTDAHTLAVIELGMNHPGETAYLADVLEPTVALINNAQREHQEFMLTVEAVAREHASVIDALGTDGTAVFPADDAYAAVWREAAQNRRVIDFLLVDTAGAAGVTGAAVTGTARDDAQGTVLDVVTPAGTFSVRLRTQGKHNQCNALAATAAAVAAGVPVQAIKQGLEAFEPVKGRLQVKRATVAPFAGVKVIDDSYNANPDSMRAAIDVLAAEPAPRVLIVGDMGEIGDQEEAGHREIGAYAHARGIEGFFAMGRASRFACDAFGPAARHFSSPETLLDALLASGFGAGATLLVKGSRFMAMERIVNALTAEPVPAVQDGQGAHAQTNSHH